MTPKELKYYLQKELLKVRNRRPVMFLCDDIDCSYNGLKSFLYDRSKTGAIPVALKVVCFLINLGIIELKGGVKHE